MKMNCFLKVNLSIEYKYITTYRQVLKAPVIDACYIVDGTILNPLTSMIMNIFRDSGFKHIIHTCPYTVIILQKYSIHSQPKLNDYRKWWFTISHN